MINASELRIGNIVFSFGTNGSPSEWKEIIINADHINTCATNSVLFSPITLTDQRLLKLGFKQSGKYTYRIKVGRQITNKLMYLKVHIFEYGNKEIKYVWYIDSFCQFKNVQSVHQLQNLFFVLTGKELSP